MRSGKLTLSLLAALPLLPSLAHAQIMAGGTGSGNSIPFGNFSGLTYPSEYQEVYSSTDFSTTTNISSIAFASNSGASSGIATYNITVGLSTTARAVNGLSTNYASNEGANFTTVFSGTLHPDLLFTNTFDLIIPSSGFTYNPALGNLLLDVVVNATPTFPGGGTIYYVAGVSADASRLFTNGGSPATDSTSLLTQFGTLPATTTPEPGSVALLVGMGVTGFGILRRRRKK